MQSNAEDKEDVCFYVYINMYVHICMYVCMISMDFDGFPGAQGAFLGGLNRT